jgi:predicted permease
LRELAGKDRADDLLGDLEEAHRRRVERRGGSVANAVTALETLDLARALIWDRMTTRGMPVSLIDFKLGARMLVRYPGLTVLGGLAMAFGICAGTASFEVMRQLTAPELPFEDGDRIVGMWVVDTEANDREPRILHDFLMWRTELRSVHQLSAYRTIGRNVWLEQGQPVPSAVAETTASAFRIANVQPLLGRTLVDQDERLDAPLVVVLGFDLWQTLFEGDPEVVGRAVRIGEDVATVVGVMPEKHAFPQAELWTPLRLNPLDYGLRASPAITVVGRLAEGATVEQASVELAALGQRAARDQPATHAKLLPRVAEFPLMYFPGPDFFSPEIATANLFVLAVIVLLGSNVALLMFARAAARESELVIRSALGAGRRRIVGQLFAEALVLAAVSAVFGIAGGQLLFGTGITMISAAEGALPFWIRRSLSAESVLYGAALTVLVAAVAGVLPGLQATRRTGARLRESTSGGGGMRFGGIWTGVIVTQVALAVSFPAATFFLWQEARRQLDFGVEIPAHELVVALLQRDGAEWTRTWGEATIEPEAVATGNAAAVSELERRLEGDPSVNGVTFVDGLPGVYHPWSRIELDAGAVEPPDGRGHRAARALIRLDYFEVLGAPVVAGRLLDTRDVETGAPVVLVDEPFVERVLGGQNAVGRLVRYVADEQDREPRDDGPWFEIVGVVPDLGLESSGGRGGIYHAASPTEYPTYMVAHVRGDSGDMAARLRAAATAIDPTLQVQAVMTLEAVMDPGDYAYWIGLAILVTTLIMVLSLASTYSVTSFTVSRRTREIGVRVALGADPLLVLRAIMRRPVFRVLCGTFGGAALVAWMVWYGISTVEGLGFLQVALIAAYAVVMLGVSLIACVVPARRALAVEPREALTSDA